MRRSFSLLEILVAASLLTGLLTAAFFSFSSVRRSLNQGRETFEFFRKGVVIARRLEMLLVEASPDGQKAKDCHFKGDSSKLSFTTLRGRNKFSPPRFVRLQKEKDGVYLETDYLRWLIDKPPKESLYREKLLNVTSMKLSYSDGKDDTWLEEWDVARKSKLPSLIRLEIEIKNKSALVIPLTIIVKTRLERDPSIR